MIAKLSFLFLMITVSGSSLYEFKMKAIDGKVVDFASFKGKNVLIVNTASKCGYTPQYAELQQLHENFGSKVIILGFPANNFGAQEPGSNVEIAQFCSANYGVTFQMFEKISVKGDDQHPLYQWLKAQTKQEPSWNFCKYLVTADGKVTFFPSKVSPMDKQIIDALH